MESESQAANSQPRRKPRQKRAEETIGRILDATAELLEEVGFDRLNTNIICERAGLTPPALYRYFPNKYAVLKMLGERLMQVQNEALFKLVEDAGGKGPTAQSVAAILANQFEVTVQQQGAGWILRALHATPQLANVRMASHASMVEWFVEQFGRSYPDIDEAELTRRSRIAVEAGYVLLEMLIDNPAMDRQATFADFGKMVVALLD